MKKIALLTFGLLLAASPAFAEAVVDQYSTGNQDGNSWGTSYSNAGNEGVGNSAISNAEGIINQNINTGNGSNVGSSTDVVVTGGLSSYSGNGGTGVNAGSSSDTNNTLSLASLVQVTANSSIGNAEGTISNSNSSNLGINNVGINDVQGVVTQSINAGNSSNVGSAIGITVH